MAFTHALFEKSTWGNIVLTSALQWHAMFMVFPQRASQSADPVEAMASLLPAQPFSRAAGKDVPDWARIQRGSFKKDLSCKSCGNIEVGHVHFPRCQVMCRNS